MAYETLRIIFSVAMTFSNQYFHHFFQVFVIGELLDDINTADQIFSSNFFQFIYNTDSILLASKK